MSLIDQARRELELISYDLGETEVMLRIMRIFFDEWDSGGAVAAAMGIFQRLIAGKPLSPLTGEDREWVDQAEANGGKPLWQNIRCSSVFKDEHGVYDIEAVGDPGQSADPKRRYITFPYWPARAEVWMPIMEVEIPARKL